MEMAPRETGNNAYAKFWGDKERALWYVMVFSGVVNEAMLLRLPSLKLLCNNNEIIGIFQISKSNYSTEISIGNSMICSDIWHKYHE